MWDRLKIITRPANQILSLDDAKAHLRVDFNDDDSLISSLIDVSTAYIDGPNGIGVAMLTQQWEMSLDMFDDYYIRIPLGPVQSVDSITFISPDGTTHTLDPSLYVVSYGRNPCTIARAFGAVWPVVQQTIGAITVTFTTGFGDDPEDVPADLLHAMRLIMGNLYENRSGVIGIDSRDSPAEMPLGVEYIFSRYRALPFG